MDLKSLRDPALTLASRNPKMPATLRTLSLVTRLRFLDLRSLGSGAHKMVWMFQNGDSSYPRGPDGSGSYTGLGDEKLHAWYTQPESEEVDLTTTRAHNLP